jgi:hypothetical protein
MQTSVSVYDTVTDSSSSSSTSSSSDDDDINIDDMTDNCNQPTKEHCHDRLYTESLGRMIPLQQNVLRVDNNFLRTYNIVIHSRNRNVLNEHLFAFAVNFGAVSKGYDSPQDECHSVVESSRFDMESKKIAQTHPSNIVISPTSKCVIERTFNNVQELFVSTVLIPTTAFIQSTNILSTTPSTMVTLAPPQELYVQLTPNGSRHLYSTDAITNQCSFICAPTTTDADSTNRQYKTIHDAYAYDTPVNYLNHIDFRLHTLLDRLKYNPFGTKQTNGQSPDVCYIHQIAYETNTNQLQIYITESNVSYSSLSIGQLVSFVNLTLTNITVQLFDENQTKLYNMLYLILHKHSFIVVKKNETSALKLVYVSLDTLQLTPSVSPLADTSISVNPNESIMLNESMQHTMVVQLKCLEKRLQQTF